jgi:LysM repeat protein
MLKKVIVLAGLFTSLNFMYAEDYDSQRSFQVQVVTSLKSNETRLNTAIERINSLQDNYAVLVQNVNSMRNALAVEQQKNADLRLQIDTLKKQIASDRTTMQQSLSTAVDKIAKEPSAAVTKATAVSKAASAQGNNGKPPYGTGKFAAYKVQERATLAAVAKAYGVTPESIKKANGFKGNNLIVGQTIYIPQK